MKKTLEQNYISIILILNDFKDQVNKKIREIDSILTTNFKGSEIIIVDNTVTDKKIEIQDLKTKYTVIKLPIKHAGQQALNAGVGMAIGDYIIEIEDILIDIDYHIILEMYQKSQKGYDFVFLTPQKIKITSKIFYSILNRYFKNMFNANIGSSIMTLSSRRGQNKIAGIGKRVINRNVAYILSGLKTFSMTIDIHYRNSRALSDNMMLMLDTLIYYTDTIVLCSQKFAFIFFFLFLLGIVHSFILNGIYNIIESWLFLFVLVNFGFFGIFSILSIATRYLHQILRNSFNAKDYIYRTIDKN